MSEISRGSTLRESFSRVLPRKSETPNKVDRLRGRYLFRAVVRIILGYIRWLTEPAQTEEIGDDVATNVKLAQQKKIEKKAVTFEDRTILLTNPHTRTPVERTHIFELFKKLRAFKKYSDNLRERLAEVCVYQYLPAGRVIVKQGRQAENLYFIANGEVSLSRVAIDNLTGDSIEIDMGTMHPEDTFGEVALLHIIPRTATVVTKTNVDLLLIPREDFDVILRSTLMEEWDVSQDALVHFNYFKSWDKETIRECCILSKLKEFRPDQVLLGDGKGMVNYVHFIVEGECRLIEHMHVRERSSQNKVHYELYDPKNPNRARGTGVRRKSEIVDEKLKELEYEIARNDNTSELNIRRGKRVDVERTSIVTTTLLDVVNEWHEITDVAEMLMREPSSISQQRYPTDVRTIFMQICIFQRGACFGLGEKMQDRRIVSVTPVRCFLIPRYWLREHNRANIWERVKLFMDSKYPKKRQLFEEFVRNRKWCKHKENLLNDVIKNGRRIRSNVTIHDVPYSIRINNDVNL